MSGNSVSSTDTCLISSVFTESRCARSLRARSITCSFVKAIRQEPPRDRLISRLTCSFEALFPPKPVHLSPDARCHILRPQSSDRQSHSAIVKQSNSLRYIVEQ